jgi:hypothetical protein
LRNYVDVDKNGIVLKKSSVSDPESDAFLPPGYGIRDQFFWIPDLAVFLVRFLWNWATTVYVKNCS